MIIRIPNPPNKKRDDNPSVIRKLSPNKLLYKSNLFRRFSNWVLEVMPYNYIISKNLTDLDNMKELYLNTIEDIKHLKYHDDDEFPFSDISLRGHYPFGFIIGKNGCIRITNDGELYRGFDSWKIKGGNTFMFMTKAPKRSIEINELNDLYEHLVHSVSYSDVIKNATKPTRKRFNRLLRKYPGVIRYGYFDDPWTKKRKEFEKRCATEREEILAFYNKTGIFKWSKERRLPEIIYDKIAEHKKELKALLKRDGFTQKSSVTHLLKLLNKEMKERKMMEKYKAGLKK